MPEYFNLSKYRQKFENKLSNFNWLADGIFMSEGFLFCSLADYFKVDTIIESGVCNGVSTEIFLKYFSSLPLYSIDLGERQKRVQGSMKRLAHHKNLHFIQGDGCVEVITYACLAEGKKKKVAILIDGPKYRQAMDLAQKCLLLDSVQFVAIHDMGEGLIRASKSASRSKKEECIQEIKTWPSHRINTDENWFRKQYGDLDKKLGGNGKDKRRWMKKYPQGCGLSILSNQNFDIRK